MLVKDFSNVSSCLRICSQCSRSSVRRTTNLQRVPQSASDLVLSDSSRYQVCTVKPNMLGFGYWIYLLLCYSLSKICVRYHLVELSKKILVQM